MKMALVTDGVWPFVVGGMQKHSYLLCKYLAREGIHIVVLYPGGVEYSSETLNTLFTGEEMKFIEWVNIPRSNRYSFPGHYLVESYLYSKNCFQFLACREDIGFIYAKGLTSWYLLRYKDKLRCKIGINIHGYEFMQLPANFKERANAMMLAWPFRYLHRRADFVFSYGSEITSYIKLLGVAEEQIIEIPGAVESSWLRGNLRKSETYRKRRLFFMGRYERRKGVEEILQVLIRSELIKDDAEFHFIGAIPPKKRLAEPGIYYHGQLTDSKQILALVDGMDVLVCPSYSEGMPNVIMESMARGCAIIGTDVGAVSLLVDNHNGWLICPGSYSQLEAAVASAITCSNDIIATMGAVSINRISENFTWDIVGRKTAKFIRRFVE